MMRSLRYFVLYCIRFIVGIVNPRWMPQAPSGESAEQTVRLVWVIHTWHPRVRVVASLITWVLAIYTILSFF